MATNPRSPTADIKVEIDKLPDLANTVRAEIRDMIPETAISGLTIAPADLSSSTEDEHGNKKYTGRMLEEKVSLFVLKMEIGTAWRWELVIWQKPGRLVYDRDYGYLIPLSKKINLMPGGEVEEGQYAKVSGQPSFSPKAAAIFLVPL
ncbi:hypothetical protein N7478_000731 [Penicillium angulare]|uniref:uncharacterized protein n=1 Tax=Penicillium angulare TaxID=116970 RepID=UPI0025425180|nr:uncharacterized protein N7478_000731 [Penicillium angulare]KAJ5291480.1 hypothetical protein N7478_000731 [Penicillium angulare]